MAYKPTVATVPEGGTGLATLTAHGVLIGEGTSNIAATASGSANQVLQSGGAAADPVWSTATFPGTATSTGTLLRADGTNWVATTSTYPNTNAISTLLYASDTNVMSALTTANGGVLVTSNTGVPSILAGSGTSGQVLQTVSGAAPAWSTTTYPSTSGSAGVILRSDGTNYVPTTSTYPATNAVSTLLYASSANVMSALATANSSVLVTNGSGVPSLTNALPLVTMASQATFIALIATGTNVTGDSTVYTLTSSSIPINTGSGFSGGTFTVPTGQGGTYALTAEVVLKDLGAANTYGYITITTTNRIYDNYTFFSSASQYAGILMATIADMSAGHTCTYNTAVFGGTKIVDVVQGFFTGRFLG